MDDVTDSMARVSISDNDSKLLPVLGSDTTRRAGVLVLRWNRQRGIQVLLLKGVNTWERFENGTLKWVSTRPKDCRGWRLCEGKWGPPKGHVKTLETDTAGGIREFEEETGIEYLDAAFRELFRTRVSKTFMLVVESRRFNLDWNLQKEEIFAARWVDLQTWRNEVKSGSKVHNAVSRELSQLRFKL